MTAEEIDTRARDLVEPIIDVARAESLIATVGQLEKLASVRELRPLLQG